MSSGKVTLPEGICPLDLAMGVVQEVSKLEPLKYVPSCYPIPEKKLDKHKYKRPITQGHEADFFCPTYLCTKFPSANLAEYLFRYSIWLILIVSVCNRKSMWPIYVVSLSVSTSASSTCPPSPPLSTWECPWAPNWPWDHKRQDLPRRCLRRKILWWTKNHMDHWFTNISFGVSEYHYNILQHNGMYHCVTILERA